MPKCQKCGTENDADSDYCEKCGAPLKPGNPQQKIGQGKDNDYCPNCKQKVVPKTPKSYWGGAIVTLFVALLLSARLGPRFVFFFIILLIIFIILKPKECPMCKYRFKRGVKS